MTTVAQRSCAPIIIDPVQYAENFAKWKHPTNVAAQAACKYNMTAMCANTALVATVASIALACFSNFIILGLALTAVSGLAYCIAEQEITKDRSIPLEIPQRMLISIKDLPIALFRCYSAPDATPKEKPGTGSGSDNKEQKTEYGRV